MRAWRELPGLRDAERWSAWFRRITVNAAIDAGRRKKAMRIVPLAFHEPSPMADSSVGLAERDEVTQAMSHLDANDRALLALRFGHDLELPDVAAALDIPLGTAKSRLHRALGRMRKELETVDELRRHRESASGETGCGVNLSQPSPGFEDRVRRSLTPRGAGSRRWSRALRGVVGLAAVLALAAVAVPWMTGPRAGAGPGGSGDDAASPSATPEPTLAPTSSDRVTHSGPGRPRPEVVPVLRLSGRLDRHGPGYHSRDRRAQRGLDRSGGTCRLRLRRQQ